LQQSSSPSNRTQETRRSFPWARLWDVAAALVLAFALWKILVAPRYFGAAATSQPAPHAVFARLDGKQFRIIDARGHLLFLDFYASWCTPCRIELPLVRSWAKAHSDAVVVPVDVAEPRAVAEDFARRYDLGNVAIDPHGDAQGIFEINGLPTIVVVDPQGRIRAKWQGLNPAISLAMSNAESNLGREH